MGNNKNGINYRGLQISEKPDTRLLVTVEEFEASLYYEGEELKDLSLPLSHVHGIIDSVEVDEAYNDAIKDFIEYNSSDIIKYFIEEIREKSGIVVDEFMSYYGYDYTELATSLFMGDDAITSYVSDAMYDCDYMNDYEVELTTEQYLNYLFDVQGLEEITANNTYNWNGNISNIIDYRVYKDIRDNFLVAYSIHDGVSDARVGYSNEKIVCFNNEYRFYEALHETSITAFTIDNNGVDYEVACLYSAGSEEVLITVNGDSELTVYGYHTIGDIVDILIDEHPELLGLNIEDEALTIYDLERYSLNFNYLNSFTDINTVITLEAVRMLFEELLSKYTIMDRIKSIDYINRNGDIEVVTDFNVIEISNFNIIPITDSNSIAVFGIKDRITNDEALIRICIN